MRYLLSMILLCSLAGFSYAEEQMTQLPANTDTVQIMGKTYYKSGDTFYRFSPEGKYFYQVQPPSALPQYQQPEHMSHRDRTLPATNLSGDLVEGCRNKAADISNAKPNVASEVYIQEYNRCISTLNQ